MRNQTRNTVLGEAADVADTSAKRRVGLLKHERLEPGEGLWIVPCESVHTFFMKFPIDLVYLDKKRKVRKGEARGSGVAAVGLPDGAFDSGAAGRDRGETGTAVGDELVDGKA